MSAGQGQGPVGVAFSSGTAGQPPANPIPERVQSLDIVLQETSEVIDRLIQEIMPILGPPNPENPGVDATAGNFSSMAMQIDGLLEVAYRNRERLKDLLTRIEI